jgi:hypothetical protein
MSAFDKKTDIEENYTKRSVVISLGLHLLLAMMNLKIFMIVEPPEKKEEAIQVTLIPIPAKIEQAKKVVVTPPPPMPKPVVSDVQKTIIPKTEQEIVKVKPAEPVVAGTEVVVPKSEALGNPEAKKKQIVQKGDPQSQQKVAHKKDTQLRFRKSPRIGTGALAKSSVPVKKIDAGGHNGPVEKVKQVQVDTYQGLDVQKNLAFLSSPSDVKVVTSKRLGTGDGGVGNGYGGGVGNGIGKGIEQGNGDGHYTGSPNGTMELAKVSTNIGSLTGTQGGKIDFSKGEAGLGKRKGNALLPGVVAQRVEMSAIDKNLVMEILREHLPQFRYCYQKQLDEGRSAASLDRYQGIVQLRFVIMATGRASAISVSSKNETLSTVQNCVKDVLSGIQFPRPKGGGSVEFTQQMNFFANYL